MDGGPGLVEDGPSRDRDLVMALPAFPKEPPRQLVRVFGAANWTPEAVRPAAPKEVLPTISVVWKPALELDDRPRKVRPRHCEIVPELTG